MFVFLLVGCAQPNFPEFKGHVVDEAGIPIPGALVKLIKIPYQALVSTPIDYALTDENGEFDFSETDLDLQNGYNFVIFVSKRGYRPDAQHVVCFKSSKKRDPFILSAKKNLVAGAR
jgi:hypothetical protein